MWCTIHDFCSASKKCAGANEIVIFQKSILQGRKWVVSKKEDAVPNGV
jgi:hypothetical protein